MIEVRQARYFLAVAETLHFGRAAEQLVMSQPPLSQAILQLERQLDVTLFDRSGRKVTLTETGRAFAAQCRKLLAAAQHAQEVAIQAEAGLVGTLRIGVVTSALSEPLLSTLTAFRHASPRVDLQITEVDTARGRASPAPARNRHRRHTARTPVRGLRIQPAAPRRVRDRTPTQPPPRGRRPQPCPPGPLRRRAVGVAAPRASPDHHDQLMAPAAGVGFTPTLQHGASRQLDLHPAGHGDLRPRCHPRTQRERAPDPAAVTYRRLTDRADIVELSLVSRDGAQEPLTERFLSIATR